MNQRISCLAFLMSLLSIYVSAAVNIKGKVYDAKTKEELVGATVQIKALRLGTISGLDGSYHFTGINNGTYIVTCSYMGFKTFEKKVSIVSQANKDYILNIQLLPENLQLNEVVVTASANKESEISSRISEKISSNVLNVISANAIQASPDLTVANVLQRVSGVSVEKDGQGEGKYSIIRGMDKRYSYTLVNGIKIPSPDDKNRYVPLDIFPADLLERLEVTKSLTPDMEGDAIGGAMNLVMKNAPDKFTFKANAATGYSQLLFEQSFRKFDYGVIQDQSPAEKFGPDHLATPDEFTLGNYKYHNVHAAPDMIFGLTIGNRFLKDKRLGVLISGSYQNFNRSANSSFYTLHLQPEIDNIPVFDDMQIRKYSTRQTRIGVNAKVDYTFNPKHKLNLSYLFVKLDQIQSREMVDTALFAHRTGPGNGRVDLFDRSKVQKQNIHNVALRGDHQLARDWAFNWTGSYSSAFNALPDWGSVSTTHNVTTVNGVSEETPSLMQSMTRYWQHNSDKDYTGSANLSFSPHWGDIQWNITTGALYRHKNRDNYMNEYTLSAAPINNMPQVFTSIDDIVFSFRPASAAAGKTINPNTYTSKEDITAGYLQAKAVFGQWEVLGGVRVESTKQEYATVMPEDFDGRIGSNSYVDILPGLHLKYRLRDNQNLRLSYYKSISRPGFFEVIPYSLAGEFYTETGNPYLKHTTADNVDLRYEFFPTGVDQLLVGAFYKNIQNPIEQVLTVGTVSGGLVMRPDNFGSASNYGAELVLTKFFHNIGVSLNYTFTESNITTDKAYYYRNSNGEITTEMRKVKRPLQGQSKHVGNATLMYKDAVKGINSQLSAVYTGRRIAQLSPFEGLDYWQRAAVQLDFSAEKEFGHNFIIYAKVNNILNTPTTVEIEKPNTKGTFYPGQDSNSRLIVQKSIYKPSYQIGFRVNFTSLKK